MAAAAHKHETHKLAEVMRKTGMLKDPKEDCIQYSKVIEFYFQAAIQTSLSTPVENVKETSRSRSEVLDCQLVGREIEKYVRECIGERGISPSVSIVLSHNS